jgi:hypothetical protein
VIILIVRAGLQIHNKISGEFIFVHTPEIHTWVDPALVAREPLAAEAIHAADRRQLAVIEHSVDLIDDARSKMTKKICVEPRQLGE